MHKQTHRKKSLQNQGRLGNPENPVSGQLEDRMVGWSSTVVRHVLIRPWACASPSAADVAVVFVFFSRLEVKEEADHLGNLPSFCLPRNLV